MADRYGDNYVLDKSKTLSKNYPYWDQYDTSVYYQLKDGNKYSESNCTLNSIFTILSFLQNTNNSYKEFPTIKECIMFDAITDSFYDKFSKNKNYSIEMPKELPKLYCDIRQYAIKKGYYHIKSGFLTFAGTLPFDIVKIIKGIGKKYDIKMKPKHIVGGKFKKQVMKEIDAGYPIIFNVNLHPVYGNHSVVVTGYRVYKKTKKILGFKITKKVYIMEISDNWDYNIVYLDYSSYKGLRSFVKIR